MLLRDPRGYASFQLGSLIWGLQAQETSKITEKGAFTESIINNMIRALAGTSLPVEVRYVDRVGFIF